MKSTTKMDDETRKLIMLSREQIERIIAFTADLFEENIKKSNLRFDEDLIVDFTSPFSYNASAVRRKDSCDRRGGWEVGKFIEVILMGRYHRKSTFVEESLTLEDVILPELIKYPKGTKVFVNGVQLERLKLCKKISENLCPVNSKVCVVFVEPSKEIKP